jgi:hypothetical protein
MFGLDLRPEIKERNQFLSIHLLKESIHFLTHFLHLIIFHSLKETIQFIHLTG